MTIIPYEASELARVLGGVRAHGTILLAGEAGAGKSTVAAELAAAVAEARGGLSYWLDRDQQAHDLIATLFTRINESMDRVVLVEERDPGEEGYEPLDWRGALAHVPDEAACVVVGLARDLGRLLRRAGRPGARGVRPWSGGEAHPLRHERRGRRGGARPTPARRRCRARARHRRMVGEEAPLAARLPPSASRGSRARRRRRASSIRAASASPTSRSTAGR
jgi:hypothetical protein